MRTLILAGSFNEAATYARGNGLTHYRYASSASAVENFAAQQIVQLPGYGRRRDIHAINAVVTRLKRRGVELVEDSYTPPAPEPGPSYGEAGYKADLLLGDVPPLTAFSDDELRSLGATDEEVQKVQDLRVAEANAAAILQDVRAKQPEARETARVNAAKSTESLENKVSGRGQKSGPKATKPAKVKTADVDDLFED